MPSYALNPNGMLDTGDELSVITTKLGSALDDLNEIVTRFISTNSGGASDSFRAAQAQWNQGYQEMQASLARGATAINEIHDIYRMGDARGASLFGGQV
ncbi:WXG100 family type VII secretion target [Catellatospora citrea]|uniref:WXG100 family type VII secretion target n=1 Tax=Catellatospora citrea TaxID=53366 RepID=A0A8J3KHK6_9ACTN|nr:WXG100 family type VII secretion target [Catellatospora citrea]RKE10664.1 WXG100 family type VII secretion target [Catellatospora citrea]GIG03083.1 hypothetical protein Cci01nite_81760 [Catellatospora citrea]